jgi:hypothetical protein
LREGLLPKKLLLLLREGAWTSTAVLFPFDECPWARADTCCLVRPLLLTLLLQLRFCDPSRLLEGQAGP